MKAIILSFVISIDLGAVYAQDKAPCEVSQGYIDTLSTDLEKSRTEQLLLRRLSNKEPIELSKAKNLFAVDISKDEPSNQRKLALLEKFKMKDWGFTKAKPLPKQCKYLETKVKGLEQELETNLKEIIELKIKFLSLESSERIRLTSKPETVDDFELKSDAIEEKLKSEEEFRKEIESATSKARQEVAKAETKNEKELAEAIVALESYRANVATISVTWLSDLKDILNKYDTISKKLTEIESNVYQVGEEPSNLTKKKLSRAFRETTLQWRTLIDDGFVVYHMVFDPSDIHKIPQNPDQLLKQLPTDEVKNYENLRQKAILERDALLSSQHNKIEERFNDFYRLLSRASKIRSNLLTQIDNANMSILELNDDYLNDLSREIFAIPFRFFGIIFQKYVDIKSNMSNGLLGIWNIIQSFFALILVLFIPFLARYISTKVKYYLDQYRSSLLRNRLRTDTKYLSFAIWVQRITPYSPWLLYGLFLILINDQLTDTILEEITIIIPILGYIIVYKIFRLLISDVLSSLKKYVKIDQDDTKVLIDSTSKLVGFFFLFSYIFLYLTEVTVEEGLLFRHISDAMQVLGVIICAVAARRWRHYLAPAAASILSPRLGSFLSEKCEGNAALFFSLPTLIIILVKLVANASWEWASELEFSKRFLAKLYRKKVESIVGDKTVATDQNTPESYSNLFTDVGLKDDTFTIKANQEAFDTIISEINGWLKHDEDDQSLAIYGEKGIGKTTLLDRVASQFKDLNIVRLNIPKKIWKKDELNQFLSEHLGFEKSESIKKGILEFNRSLEKDTLILVDDAHNLFLGKYGGFDAFYEYIDLVNLKTDKIFWCSVFNEYSWAYIKGVLGPSQYLRTEILLDSWSDESIKDLILARHSQSKFKLSYDHIILASRSAADRSDAILEAEEQFFRLLWEQSNGNPRVALFLWVNCLHLSGHQTLKVSLPERPKAERFNLLDDNAWFVLASIAKHENLTRSEAVSTTNLEWAQVAHAIKVGLENKLLHRSEGNRYRLHFTYQSDLIRQLKMKNFIYGIN